MAAKGGAMKTIARMHRVTGATASAVLPALSLLLATAPSQAAEESFGAIVAAAKAHDPPASAIALAIVEGRWAGG